MHPVAWSQACQLPAPRRAPESLRSAGCAASIPADLISVQFAWFGPFAFKGGARFLETFECAVFDWFIVGAEAESATATGFRIRL